MPESVPTLYTSRSEIEKIFSQLAIDQRIDDNFDETISAAEETILDDIIEEATDIFNQYLLTHYTESALSNSRWVRRRCSYIACYLLSQRRGNPAQFEQQYEEIIRTLILISQGPASGGRPHIPRTPTRTDTRPVMSNIKIDNRFARGKIRVQPATSTGQSPPSQDSELTPPYDY